MQLLDQQCPKVCNLTLLPPFNPGPPCSALFKGLAERSRHAANSSTSNRPPALPGTPQGNHAGAMVPFQAASSAAHSGAAVQLRADDLCSLLEALASLFRAAPAVWYDTGLAPESMREVGMLLSKVGVLRRQKWMVCVVLCGACCVVRHRLGA